MGIRANENFPGPKRKDCNQLVRFRASFFVALVMYVFVRKLATCKVLEFQQTLLKFESANSVSKVSCFVSTPCNSLNIACKSTPLVGYRYRAHRFCVQRHSTIRDTEFGEEKLFENTENIFLTSDGFVCFAVPAPPSAQTR